MTQSEQVEWFRYSEVETFVTDRLDQFVAAVHQPSRAIQFAIGLHHLASRFDFGV